MANSARELLETEIAKAEKVKQAAIREDSIGAYYAAVEREAKAQRRLDQITQPDPGNAESGVFDGV